MMSLFIISYLTEVRPFKNMKHNNLELFNEISIMVLNYFTILFTDFVNSPEIKNIIGYIYILISLLNLIVNTLVILIDELKQIFKYFRP